MNAISETVSIRGALASAETSAIASETTTDRLERALDSASVRQLSRYSGEVLQGIAWVLATVYLVGAMVLSGAMLYYTFVR